MTTPAPPTNPERYMAEVYGGDHNDSNANTNELDFHYDPKDFEDPEPAVASLVGAVPDTDDDAAFALKVQQEMRDEALARYVEQEESALRAQQEMLSRQTATQFVVQEQQAHVETQRRRRCRAVKWLLCSGTLLAVALGLALYFLLGNNGQIPILDRFKDDPFDGTDANDGDGPRWDKDGDGPLQLEVVNALEPEWDEEFNLSVSEWDASDAMILTTTNVDHDSDCSPIRGKLKVCNGNYGNTNWYGLNSLMLNRDQTRIFSSAALINDSLLDLNSQERRQYTMCHEIGHGFGLPHTDEDFYNKNLGNCMDYTQYPGTNQSPDESNYQLLERLYGDGTVSTASTTAGGGDRNRRGLLRTNRGTLEIQDSMATAVVDAVSDKAMKRYADTLLGLEQGQDPTSLCGNGVKLLASSSDTAGTDEIVFDISNSDGDDADNEDEEGFVVVVHMLLKEDA